MMYKPFAQAINRRPVRTSVPGLLALLPVLGLLAACSKALPVQLSGADAERGKAAIEAYGCVACHAIPGIANQGSNVGPPLHKIRQRAYIAGVLPNTPDDMVRWLRNPPQVNPRTAMPNMGVSEAEAKDIAAYLYTMD